MNVKNATTLLATLLATLFLLSACNNSSRQQPLGTVIIPQPGENIALFSPSSINNNSILAEDQASLPIEIAEEFIPHQIHKYNIDSDLQNEQLIVFKQRDSQDDFIGIMLVDFDVASDSYRPVWQGYTRATILRSFTPYIDDVIGDQRQEIIAIGVNNQGEQTLDIFRQAPAADGQWSSALSIRADIAININNIDRTTISDPNSPELAYTVSSLNYDRETEGAEDLVQSLYTWRQNDEQYRLASTEKIPSNTIEQDQLAALYAGSLDDFHIFLDGLWQQESSDQIILFSHNTDTIQMATSDRQLHFRWINSTRWNISNNLWIYAQNEIISNIVQRIQISVLDLDTLLMQFSGGSSNTFWSGTYRRLNNQSLESSSQYSSNQKNLYPYEISGLYVSDSDWEMFFAAPYITLRTQERELNGGYVIFQLNGQSILEINFFDKNEILIEKQTYLISFEQENTDNQLRRRIYMEEAVLNSYGVQLLNNETVRLEQVIPLE